MTDPQFRHALPRHGILPVVTAMVLLLAAGPVLAFETISCPLANGFDYPVGKPEAKGYHKARGFWPNGHMGEDWNGNNGGDMDLGDPIFAIGSGVVVLSEDVKLGWGNCVIIRHIFREPSGKIEMVDSLYGHLLERKVKVGERMERGQLVGRMGSNNGMYPAHLHLEIRKSLAIGMNRSKFARDYSNYYSPSAFIQGHRQLAGDYKKYDVPVNTFAPYGQELNREQLAFANSRGSVSVASASSRSSPGSGSKKAGLNESSSSVTKSAGGLSVPITTSRGTGSTKEPKESRESTLPKVTVEGKKESTLPKVTAEGKKESALPKVAVDGKKPEPVPLMVPPEEPKSDFWTRLKSKLNNGQVTDAPSATTK